MVRDELFGADTYGIKELGQGATTKMLASANFDGFAFITKHNKAIAMVLPFSSNGFSKTFKKLDELVKSDKEIDEDFYKSFKALYENLEKLK